MDPISSKTALASAGAGGEGLYVDDVFSTHLWDGTGSTQTITNGIDLAGEGGMIWTKAREVAENHMVFDSERGKTGSYYDALQTNVSNADYTDAPYGPTSFNSNGFTLAGNNAQFNGSGDGSYCSWTFRKCPGFFDVVTYTGNATGRNISHSLGSEPGSIWIKRTDSSESWIVYHRSLHPGGGGTAATEFFSKLELESSGDQFGATKLWSPSASGGEAHTASTFYVHSHGSVNENGGTFVAYLFAHDDQSFGDAGNEAIIKCGSYTGNGTSSSSINTITLGFEPQWVMIKRTSSSGDWVMLDTMRGFTAAGVDDEYLLANTSGAAGSFSQGSPTSTGFQVEGTNGDINGDAATFVYIAIRRPHKPPETAAECFDVFSQAGSSSTQLRPGTAGSSVTDMAIIKNRTSAGYNWIVGARLLGPQTLKTNATDAATTGTFGTSVNVWDQMSGTELNFDGDINRNSDNYINYHFARKPGFIDVVTYTGTGSTKTESHNLGVAPEMMWVKRRSGAVNWAVYYGDNTDYLILNSNAASIDNHELWNDTSPTASVFTVGPDNDVNANTETYIAYLFATLPGISKVGSYAGTGNNINVDCGFTNGARFILIKAIDRTGSWWVFDSARGIGSGNDPNLYLNSTSAEFSSDRLAALSSGFTVGTGDFELNQSGKNYIFLAIA